MKKERTTKILHYWKCDYSTSMQTITTNAQGSDRKSRNNKMSLSWKYITGKEGDIIGSEPALLQSLRLDSAPATLMPAEPVSRSSFRRCRPEYGCNRATKRMIKKARPNPPLWKPPPKEGWRWATNTGATWQRCASSGLLTAVPRVVQSCEYCWVHAQTQHTICNHNTVILPTYNSLSPTQGFTSNAAIKVKPYLKIQFN